ncbi:alpha/beta fold hydrolase [Streptomyces sp. NPDC060000]|uniref:alpha/beta fold hydrolase n=1 Tax=Streptomyces sp. NPDC060000 TaxID=3347031 RepID=UPI00367FACF2
MAEITHRTVRAAGRRVHVAEAGNGPLVLLLHGFPELWYSWRHQLTGLAEAGYHAVAPDMRGYGRTEIPSEVGDYTIHHLVGDVVALIGALGAERAVVAGHDWGAQVAWHTALMRPDLVDAVVGMSIPYRPRPGLPPLPAMRRAYGERFYMLWFQQPGVADRELARDVPGSLRRLFAGTSGTAPAFEPVVPEGGGFLDLYPGTTALPGWLTEDDLAVYADAFTATGFTGGLNWYRNLGANWELTAPLNRARVTVPALYLAGENDFVVRGLDHGRLDDELRRAVPGLRETVLLPDCGHWTQQERPAEVTSALVDLAGSLAPRRHRTNSFPRAKEAHS